MRGGRKARKEKGTVKKGENNKGRIKIRRDKLSEKMNNDNN